MFGEVNFVEEGLIQVRVWDLFVWRVAYTAVYSGVDARVERTFYAVAERNAETSSANGNKPNASIKKKNGDLGNSRWNVDGSWPCVAVHFAEKKWAFRGRCRYDCTDRRSRPIAHDAENRTKIAKNRPDADDTTPLFSRKIDFYNSETTWFLHRVWVIGCSLFCVFNINFKRV